MKGASKRSGIGADLLQTMDGEFILRLRQATHLLQHIFNKGDPIEDLNEDLAEQKLILRWLLQWQDGCYRAS